MWSLIQFPRQKHTRPEGTNMKGWEWKLVNDHIKNFNNNRLESLYHPQRICVNEIFSRCNGLGGDWFKIGLKNYYHMYFTPDTHCKIQDICYGSRKAILKSELVQGNDEYDTSAATNGT